MWRPFRNLVFVDAPVLDADALLARLLEDSAYVLESGGAHPLSKHLLAGAAPRATTLVTADMARHAALDALDVLAGGPDRDAVDVDFPLARHAGFLSYELGRFCDRFPPAHVSRDVPLAAFGTFDAGYVAEPGAGRAFVWGEDAAAASRLLARITARVSPRRAVDAPRMNAALESAVEDVDARRRYVDGVAAVKRYIAAGDIYQANISRRFVVPRRGDLRGLFAALCEESPAPFAAWMSLGGLELASVSPERFLAFDLGRRLAETRPIKGTRARGEEPRGDAFAARALEASEKDRAEHVMIVDLARNDLGRVAERGGVEVGTLAGLESFAHVHHLVSVVRARLLHGVCFSDLLRATFPGGSITGAPKVRAMEIIAEVEGAPRELAFGAFGWLDGAGRGDLALAIRTAYGVGERLCYASGGGIVADSDPTEEWAEATLKARAFLRAVARAPGAQWPRFV
jgi:para-aminobenzoate synthetase component 1